MFWDINFAGRYALSQKPARSSRAGTACAKSSCSSESRTHALKAIISVASFLSYLTPLKWKILKIKKIAD